MLELVAEWMHQLFMRVRAGTKRLAEWGHQQAEAVKQKVDKSKKRVFLTAADELKDIRLSGRKQADIEADLRSRGYTPVPANSGGTVWTKSMPDGNTASVRIDPAKTRNPPLGYADEVPHAHKEIVPTSKVSGGNYKPKDAVTLDENGNSSKVAKDIHLPIN